ncbi:MAG: hypothetical protein AAFP20_25335 [Cyanobacteria bacterium J06614_10]
MSFPEVPSEQINSPFSPNQDYISTLSFTISSFDVFIQASTNSSSLPVDAMVHQPTILPHSHSINVTPPKDVLNLTKI